MTLDLVLALKENKRLMGLRNNDFTVDKPRKYEVRRIVLKKDPVLFEGDVRYKRALKK